MLDGRLRWTRIWVLFALLLFPVGFAGWVVGHYTHLGSSSSTVVQRSNRASHCGRLP